jgi:glycosyltransferase involved in cell wall biosynthesis
MKPELSIVVLCYRSEELIVPYIAQMEKELLAEEITSYELVLVCNYFPGSSDTTPGIIRKMAAENPRIKPVMKEKEGMMGWDVITGFDAAEGEILALIDGDGQMPSRDIVRLYRVMKTGEFGFAKTFRAKRMDGPFRSFISFWYNMIFHILFPGALFRDMNSKPKMISRSAFSKMNLTCTGWFADGEIMLEVRRLNLPFAEVPTVFHENEWRASFIKPWTILEFLYFMMIYRLKYWFNR